MYALPNSRLIRDALDEHAGENIDSHARSRLRVSYLQARENAAYLANEIARDMPHLTVHDQTHLDALWEMADIIVPSSFTLNPADTYVLGCAILIHDLGLAVAAYPGGRQELQRDAHWQDVLVTSMKARIGRQPTASELSRPTSADVVNTERELLRLRHAERAEMLAVQAWGDGETATYLIDDHELRTTYGPLIGRVAHSHWWPTERLGLEFDSRLGAPSWCPRTWIVEPLLLACLLRCADAVHLDARRAPHFLRTLRQPSDTSAHHWTFQERLSRPIARSDRLEFTAGQPFNASEVASWWAARDTLVDVDRWLREVDALLTDSGRDKFAIRGVSGIDSPQRLARFLRTDGWRPVDTQLEVSDVAHLVSCLGGRQLYGSNRLAALRELIQNATDAVRARRTLQAQESGWGHVRVALRSTDLGDLLEVQDTGVGMTEHVLTGALLDFGRSFWATSRVTTEFPGLLGAGFQPTGQYGVGFFATFMLGKRVSVISRPYRLGEADTQVLEFRDGLDQRAILRTALGEEMMTDGGTVVRVLLDTPAARVFGSDDDEVNLAEVVRQMCPTSDVTIITRDARGEQTAVTADDWSAIDATELLLRTPNKHSPSNVNSRRVSIAIKQVAKNVRPLQLSDGSYLGRAAITPCPFYYDSVFNDIEGVVTVGGLKACRLTYIAGVLLGTSQRASRDSAIPVIPDDVLTEWASEQAKLAKTRWSNRRYQYECASAIAACGGDTGDLPIGFTREGMLSADGVKRWASSLDEIVIVQDAHIEIESRTHDNFEQGMNVIATFTGTPGILQDDPGNSDWPAYRDESSGGAWPGTLEQRVLQAIAHAWNLRLEDVVAHRKRKTGRQATAVIGEQNGRAVTYDHVSVLRRGQ